MPRSGAPLGCAMGGPCLPPEEDPPPGDAPGTAEPPSSVASAAEGEPLPASPLAPPGAAALGVPELESSEDPPPHPASANAATASARMIPTLAVVFTEFIRRR